MERVVQVNIIAAVLWSQAQRHPSVVISPLLCRTKRAAFRLPCHYPSRPCRN